MSTVNRKIKLVNWGPLASLGAGPDVTVTARHFFIYSFKKIAAMVPRLVPKCPFAPKCSFPQTSIVPVPTCPFVPNIGLPYFCKYKPGQHRTSTVLMISIIISCLFKLKKQLLANGCSFLLKVC